MIHTRQQASLSQQTNVIGLLRSSVTRRLWMKFLGESFYFGVHCHILHNQIVGFLHVSSVCERERERERDCIHSTMFKRCDILADIYF